MKKLPITFLSFLAAAAVCSVSAPVDGQASAPPAPAQSQTQRAPYAGRETDLGFSIYEATNSTTTARGIVQTPTNSGGGMIELRHIHSPLIGYEVTYSYNPADETIAPTSSSCGFYCNIPAQKFPSKGSTVGLDWVISARYGRLRPFAAGGFGFFIDEPSYSVPVGETPNPGNSYTFNDVVRPAWLYGGGVDVAVAKHWGVRIQYRGVVYKVPDLSTMFPAQGIYTQTEMPMGGIFYAF
ncbi:MAG: outer membrane protein [Terracidiphilus sp.]